MKQRERGALIVGASHAGVQLALSLRERGYEAPIRLIDQEGHEPYQRPPLSKAYLTGDMPPSSLALRAPEFYGERNIELLLGETVSDVDADEGKAVTSSGRSVDFDWLALAVGADVRRLDIPGSDLSGVLYLRTRSDADEFRARLADSRSVVVIGGGFIGLEAASMARKADKAVTVVEASDRLLARAVSPVTSEYFLGLHQRRGTRVLLGTGVEAIEGDGDRVEGVRLSTGEVLPADVVVVGIGVLPRVELATRLGLEVAGGVVVDGNARTSHPRVVAAGDCAVFQHVSSPSRMIRLESVQNAVDQSVVAAGTICGDIEHYAPVPRFWSDQYNTKLQIVGLSQGHDQVVVRSELETDKFSVLYYRAGTLIAIDAINRPGDFAVVRKILSAAGPNIPPNLASDTSVSLKDLATSCVLS